MPLDATKQAYLERLASPVLKTYIKKQKQCDRLFNQAQVSIDKIIQDINYSIHTISHPKRLQEKLSDFLSTNWEEIPSEVCIDIIQHQATEQIISDEIKGVLQARLPLKMDVKSLAETVKQVNQGIIFADKESIQDALERLAISYSNDRIQHVVSEYTLWRYTDESNTRQNKILSLLSEQIEQPSEEQKKTIHLDDPLLDYAITLLITLDKANGFKSRLILLEGDEYLFFRDTRNLTDVVTEKNLKWLYEYSQIGLDYILALRLMLTINGDLSEPNTSLNEFLLAHLKKYVQLLNEEGDEKELDEYRLKKRCEYYIQYQLAPILIKYRITSSTEDAIGLLKRIKPWTKLAMPCLIYATAFRVTNRDILVVDSPLQDEMNSFQSEWQAALDEGNKPYWYKKCGKLEKDLFNYLASYLMSGATLSLEWNDALPGMKQAFCQRIFWFHNKKSYLLSETKHISMPYGFVHSSDRKEVNENERLFTLWVKGQVSEEDKEVKRLNILLSTKSKDALVLNRLDPSAMSEQEKMMFQLEKTAKEEGMLYANICLNALYDIERNNFYGIESTIAQINQTVSLIYQENLQCLSEYQRSLLFEIKTVLNYFMKLKSDRRQSDYDIAYKMALNPSMDLNGYSLVSDLVYLVSLNTQLKKSLSTMQPENTTWQSIPCFDLCLSSLSGVSGVDMMQFHLTMAMLKRYLSSLYCDELSFDVLRSQSFQIYHSLYVSRKKLAEYKEDYFTHLSVLYPQTIQTQLKKAFRAQTHLSYEEDTKEALLPLMTFWTEAEWFIARSLIEDKKRMSKINDIYVLSKVLMIQAECYSSIAERLRRPLHLLLLHFSDIEKNGLYLGLIEALNTLNAMACVNKLKESAYKHLSDLLELELTNTESTIDSFIMSMGTLSEDEKEGLESNLLDSLNDRQLLLYNEDKACALIEYRQKTTKKEALKQFLINLTAEIREEGFSLHSLNSVIKQHAFLVLEKEGLSSFSDSTDANQIIELLDELYSILPGGRQLSFDEKQTLSTAQGLLPTIKSEESYRIEGVQDIISYAIYAPQDKLGASLMRHVRRMLLAPCELIQRDKTQKVHYAEAVYQSYLLYAAKKRVIDNPNLARWDLPGRLVSYIRLNDDDYQYVFYIVTNQWVEKTDAQEQLKQLLCDDYITDNILCVIDVRSHPVLETLFIKWLNTGLSKTDKNAESHNHLANILLSDHSSGSILPLYEEMTVYTIRLLRLLREIYEAHIGELLEYNDETWDFIYEHVSGVLNKAIQASFQSLLLSSIDANNIQIKDLNLLLDNERDDLMFNVKRSIIDGFHLYDRNHETYHFYTAWELIKQYMPIDTPAFDSSLRNDYFRVDQRNELAVRISAANLIVDAVFSSVKEQHRQLIRRNHYRSFQGISSIGTLKKQQTNIRVPSLSLQFEKVGDTYQQLTGEDAIIQMSDRLEDSYNVIKRIMGGYKGSVVYQVLSTLMTEEKSTLSLFKKQEHECLDSIIQGVHLFNQYQINRTEIDSLYYLQIIPVSHHSKPLSLSGSNPTILEATLMTEIALLNTLSHYSYELPEPIQNDLENLATQSHRLYVNYLKGVEAEETIQFSESQQGKHLCRAIESFKQKAKRYRLNDKTISFLSLNANTLYRIYVEDQFKQKYSGMFVQVISMFLEDVVIVGRESGNQAHHAVSGRAELLDSIYHRPSRLSLEEQLLVSELYAYVKGEKKALKGVKQCLDIAYNKHNLYGSQIFLDEEAYGLSESQEKQKETERTIPEIEQAMQESPYVSWLVQEHRISLKSEKQTLVNDFMEAELECQEGANKSTYFEEHNFENVFYDSVLPVKHDLLSVIIPALVKEIYLIALEPHFIKGPSTTLLTDLKKAFLLFFGLNELSFTFRHLFYFLIKINHQLGFELVFTPVIRYFIENRLRDEAGTHEPSMLLTLDETNYLPVLEEALLIKHILSPLGYNIAIYQDLDRQSLLSRLGDNDAQKTVCCIKIKDQYHLMETGISSLFKNEIHHNVIRLFHNQVITPINAQDYEKQILHLKNIVSEIVQSQKIALDSMYAEIMESDVLLMSEKKTQHSSFKSIPTKKSQSRFSNAKPLISSDEKIITLIKSLLMYDGQEKLDLKEALSLLDTKMNTKGFAKLSTLPYLILSPIKVKEYENHLQSLTQYLTTTLENTQKEKTRLHLLLIPTDPVGKLFKDKQDVLDKIENKIKQMNELDTQYQTIHSSALMILEQIKETKAQMTSRRFSTITSRLDEQSNLETSIPNINDKTILSMAITGNAFSELDKISPSQCILHEWIREKEQTISFIESANHMALVSSLNETSDLSKRAKMDLVLIMSRQLLINTEHYPSKGNKIVIKTRDEDTLFFAWGMMTHIGQRLKFNMKMFELYLFDELITLSRSKTKDCLEQIESVIPTVYLDEVVETIQLLGPLKKNALKSKSSKSIFNLLSKKRDSSD